MRPVSEPGFVTQQSADPLMDPYINITFLENNLDEVALREGIRFIDDMLMTGDGFKDIISEDDPWPMPRNSNEEMGKLILEWSQTGFRRYTHRIAVMNFKFLTVM